MNQTPAGPDDDARATIARQSQEIERLRQRITQAQAAERLRDALDMAGLAGTIAAPLSHEQLLDRVVSTAAQVIAARAGALFLIDEEANELVFEVAIGPKADEVKKFRVPLGHGIAGLVAMSGQPMAVSDAEENPQQARDIAQSVGYVPQTIVCVPLTADDRIIGVLELLDKQGAPSFSPADIDILGLFANLAALAIEQSQAQQNLVQLVTNALASAGSGAMAAGPTAPEAGLADDAAYRQALDLAQLVQEIGAQGETELECCRAILQSFARYLRFRANPLGGPRPSW
ncbi:MAG TPA: GAF domain-containing protein [Dehalococcoidia bacterium]|nr:GAF domain-containing protein [Dehalococcoidia bacterium]